ncbi:MAG: hypothetical protein EPN93_03760 [Spirochaetes bacterium]|nr:MAG: hypothetical protein EPN93_03760 [Spirochaetota bacterium]
MSSHGLEALKQICTSIARETPAGYAWAWDERFRTALLVFDAKDHERICAQVIGRFMGKWDVTTIEKASAMVHDLVRSRLDIRPGQVVFASDDGVHTLLYAAWWPWDDGSRISLRVGMCAGRAGAVIDEKLEHFIREWFDIGG